METINNKLYLNNLPLFVQTDGAITAESKNKHISVDGFDGEAPYQNIEQGIIHFYRENLIEDENIGNDIEIDLDKIGDGCLNTAGFAFWLLIIFILTIIVK